MTSKAFAWWPTSVRARLLLAFAVLAAAACGLAVVGLASMRGTAVAVEGFRAQVLPEVSVSLELSQRLAAIAANAPYVAESTLPFQLQAEADSIRARMAEAEALAASLPAGSKLAGDLNALLVEVRENVDALIEVTRRDLFLQEDAREIEYRLGGLRGGLAKGPASPGQDDLDSLLRDIEWATRESDARALRALRERVQARAAQVERLPGASPEVVRFVRSAALGEANVFVAREQHFELAVRKAYLVIRARAQAERLRERVEAYVRELRNKVDNDARAIDRAIGSGQVGIVLLALACAVSAWLGMRFVTRALGSLRGITQVMSRLAGGDLGGGLGGSSGEGNPSVPATTRRDELGELARAFEVFRENAHEVRRISRDIQLQTKLLETVFDNINDGLSVFDRDARLVAWNRHYGSLLGLPADALQKGVSIEAIQSRLPEQTGSGGPLSMLNTLRQSEGRRFELVLPGGRVVECRSSPMPGGGFVTLYSDLTERRTVEMQLRQAQKMEVLGQLTSGVAHDFNNLLAAIIGNVYLLDVSEGLSARDRRVADRISQAAERGATLTRRLLAFARRQPLAPSAVDVDALIEGLADLMDYSAGPGVALALKLQLGGHRVWVDKAQMENALLNLALNARDAMPDGGDLSLRTWADETTGQACIEVADTGQGMDAATLERVFEPFFTTKGLGNGLGLSIVYGFAKQSGGDISVQSQPGQGTRFLLQLPLGDEHEPSAAPAALVQAEAPPPAARPALPRQRVLVVEDNADVRAAAADMLRAMGHDVEVCISAEEVLRIVGPDVSLVLSDVDLGGTVNGAELVRQLAARCPSLPCVLMSGLPYEVLSSRFQLGEPDLLLAKPFSAAQLDACLRAALGVPAA